MFILSFLPVALLLWYIYKCDYHPEPVGFIIRGLFFGALSILLTSLFDSVILGVFGRWFMESEQVDAQIFKAFVGAAIPEETAKLIMLSLLLRKNKYFDEHIDGIVYAACVGLGFAGVENLTYLANSENWVGVGLSRAVTSVPSHFFDAVAMGYFYSLYRYNVQGKKSTWMVLMWLVPVLFHGVYDALLMVSSVTGETVSLLLMVLFILGMNHMRKFMKRSIALSHQLDKKGEEVTSDSQV